MIKHKARVLKTAAEIANAWRTIFEMRRRGEPDDTRDIQTPERLTVMWNTWMQEWLDEELTDDQRNRDPRRRVSLARGFTEL